MPRWHNGPAYATTHHVSDLFFFSAPIAEAELPGKLKELGSSYVDIKR